MNQPVLIILSQIILFKFMVVNKRRIFVHISHFVCGQSVMGRASVRRHSSIFQGEGERIFIGSSLLQSNPARCQRTYPSNVFDTPFDKHLTHI